jgi:hypothetical protein
MRSRGLVARGKTVQESLVSNASASGKNALRMTKTRRKKLRKAQKGTVASKLELG